MKKALLSTFSLTLVFGLSAQIYSDDFESFTAGDYIAESSEWWVTWTDSPGSNEDAFVVDDNAHSGSNSIYVQTAGGGGPQDIVLEFGELYTEGLFTMNMWLLIEEGKGAYFNFQGEETIGVSWALQMYLNDLGEFNVANASNEVVSYFTYPLGEWFKITYEINLTLNQWNVYRNDLLMGSFTNDVNQIASLNVYPYNSADFGGNGVAGMWLDDISFDIVPFETTGLNGSLTNLQPSTSGLVGQSRDVSVVVHNFGADEINSFDIEYSFNGDGETIPYSDLTMASLDNMLVEFSTPITLVEGSNDLIVTLSNINGGDDDNLMDNEVSISLNPVTPAPGKLVLGEEGTGTWCPWCPRGDVMMKFMEENYHDFFAGIAVHNGDPMTVEAYDGPFSQIHMTGYPGAVVDRGVEIDPLGFESQFLEKILVPPSATIEFGAEIDEENQVINVSATYNFVEDVNSAYRISCMLVENGVTGTGAGYAQANAYAGGANGEMGGYENLPSTVPADQMVYDHVARAISPNFNGYDNLPATVSSGESLTFNFSYAINEEWELDNMHIVAVLIETGGEIDNAGRLDLNDALANDFVPGEAVVGVENLAGPDTFNVFPNPASSEVNLMSPVAIGNDMTLKITDLSGKMVRSEQLFSTGSVMTIDIRNMSTGLYILEITSEDGIFNSRLVVE